MCGESTEGFFFLQFYNVAGIVERETGDLNGNGATVSFSKRHPISLPMVSPML